MNSVSDQLYKNNWLCVACLSIADKMVSMMRVLDHAHVLHGAITHSHCPIELTVSCTAVCKSLTGC